MENAAYKIVGTKATIASAKEEVYRGKRTAKKVEELQKPGRLLKRSVTFVKSANCHRKATD